MKIILEINKPKSVREINWIMCHLNGFDWIKSEDVHKKVGSGEYVIYEVMYSFKFRSIPCAERLLNYINMSLGLSGNNSIVFSDIKGWYDASIKHLVKLAIEGKMLPRKAADVVSKKVLKKRLIDECEKRHIPVMKLLYRK